VPGRPQARRALGRRRTADPRLPYRGAAAGPDPDRRQGLRRAEFEDLASSGFGLHLVRPDRRDEAPRHGSIGWIRQWIESVNDTLKGQLDLERHGGRTTEGLYARVAQRLLAMAVCIWHNWAAGEPVKRSLI